MALMTSHFSVAMIWTLVFFSTAVMTKGSAASMAAAVAVGDGAKQARRVEWTPAAASEGRWQSSTDEGGAAWELQHLPLALACSASSV